MRGELSHQLSFGKGFIDPSLYELDEELKEIDGLLSNPQLLKPFEEVFDEAVGQPGTPLGIYLRMMYLKFRWGLCYEKVEAEVRERLPWHYSCRLSLMDPVPDATTLIKLNRRLGEEWVTQLNRSLVKQLVKSRSCRVPPESEHWISERRMAVKMIGGVNLPGGTWSVGYFASTVRSDEETIRRYVRYQEKEDQDKPSLH